MAAEGGLVGGAGVGDGGDEGGEVIGGEGAGEGVELESCHGLGVAVGELVHATVHALPHAVRRHLCSILFYFPLMI